MQLYHAAASPFARKVRVLVREKGLLDRVEEITVNPLADPAELHFINPLGKVPALVLSDGLALFDSPVICEYLDTISGSPRFLPKEGEKRWAVLRTQALADGIMDSGVAMIYESRRPEEQRSPDWQQRRQSSILRSIRQLDVDPALLSGPVNLGSIAVACALGYLDFRLPELDWRQQHPHVAHAYASLSELPGMRATLPS
ncbi:MAG: glutathione S-transferase N-terminal domain-containing protein [Steroidobacteraceae bacterium]